LASELCTQVGRRREDKERSESESEKREERERERERRKRRKEREKERDIESHFPSLYFSGVHIRPSDVLVGTRPVLSTRAPDDR
jgi:hypothetical protein